MPTSPESTSARRRASLLALKPLTVLFLSAAAIARTQDAARPVPVPEPHPGAAGTQDPYFPGAGNGGYDVQSYDLRMQVDMPAHTIDAQVIVRLIATENLSRFDLDLVGLEVGAVEVDGEAASFTRDGRELVITPPVALRAGEAHAVSVRYSGEPGLAPDPSVEELGLEGTGWISADSGIWVVNECIGAASWLPCNDCPSDKALFRYSIRVPKPYVVAANGLLTETIEDGDERTFVWQSQHPMATYLATINIADLDLVLDEGPGGMPLRFYFPRDASAQERAAFDETKPMLEYFAELFGPYPFESFGCVLSYEKIGGALETQTLPVYGRGSGAKVVAHELAHQWFGDCVTPARWEDMWLNEGFATYAEWLWREHESGPEGLSRRIERAHMMARRTKMGAPADPGVRALFSMRTYVRGGLLLHALRAELDDELFFRLLRTWVERHFDANATTADFVALAEELAERELDDFFDAWLHGAEVPDLPAGK